MRNFDMKDDISRVENDLDDESRLDLTTNGKPIADWFREQWHSDNMEQESRNSKKSKARHRY